LVELLIVMMILAIISAVAIPMVSSTDDHQCQAAARTLISDLELAQSTALARQASVAVVFSDDRQSYKVVLADGQDLDNYAGLVAMEHPLMPGHSYEVNLAADLQLPKVHVDAVSFGGDPYVIYNTFASPAFGGSVVLTAGGASLSVAVESITGQVSVN
jgi:type II secretory pathway pseudopilin PulG